MIMMMMMNRSIFLIFLLLTATSLSHRNSLLLFLEKFSKIHQAVWGMYVQHTPAGTNKRKSNQ
jgi:uncharacterized RDD family membrane protein YckC